MYRSEADLAKSDPEFQAVVAKGRSLQGIDYVDAFHKRAQLRGRFLDIFKSVDALITPNLAMTAFAAGTIGVDRIYGQTLDQHLGWSPFSWPINLAGLPHFSAFPEGRRIGSSNDASPRTSGQSRAH